MANLQNNGNLSNDNNRQGVALFRADFENFQHDNQQVMCDLQTTITRLVLKITQIRGDSKNRSDGQQAHHDRVPSQPICKRVPKRSRNIKIFLFLLDFFIRTNFLNGCQTWKEGSQKMRGKELRHTSFSIMLQIGGINCKPLKHNKVSPKYVHGQK